MQYFNAPNICPGGNPFFDLGEPHSFLAVKLFIADSDKTPEPREGMPKKRLSLLTVCAEGFDRMESKTSEGGSNMPVRES